MDPFGELEVFVREAIIHHKVCPQAVTQGLVRHASVDLVEHLVVCLQVGSEKLFLHFPRELVRDGVSDRRRPSIRETSKHFPNSPSSRHTRL